MRLTVFGASGRTGLRLTRRALAAGHQVVAVVRDPGRLPLSPTRQLHIVAADVMAPAEIAPVIADSDAVASALGPRPGGAMTVCGDGARSIVQAMRKTPVRRLVVVSASGPYTDEGDGPVTRWAAKPILRLFLRAGFDDLREMELEVRASGLDWTILRPPRLTEGPYTGCYRTARDRNVRGGIRISREDLADCILSVLPDDHTVRHAISLGY